MSRINIEHLYRVDLDEGVAEFALSEPLMHQDAHADVFTAALRRGMIPADLTGAKAIAYLTFAATQQTLALNGAIDGSTASVTFDEDCYAIPGGFRMALQLVQSDARRTVLTLTGEIRRTATDNVITGTEVVPTLPELLEQIAATRQAATAANSAADEAIQASLEARSAAAGHSLSCAPPIICSTVGTLITVPDAAQGRAFPALSLMGKTWQDGTPTPAAPVALESIPAGSVTLSVYGANLAASRKANNVTETTQDGVACWQTAQVYDSANSLVYDLAGFQGQAAVSARIKASAATVCVLFFYDDGSYAAASSQAGTGWTNITAVSAAGKNVIQIRLGSSASTITAWVDKASVMIVPGTAPTAYAQAVERQTAAITLSDVLRGVPVSSGGNYTDENGQQWICDEVDLARGKRIQRIQHMTLTGASSWKKSGIATVDRYWLTPPHLDKTKAGVALCNLGAVTVTTSSMTGVGKIGTDSNGNISYNYAAAGASTLDSFLAAMNAKPMEIMYPRATPIETDLPAEAVAAFLQLRSPYGPMTVLNDKAVGLKVGYVADTKLYIDQKMAAIAQAVLNL